MNRVTQAPVGAAAISSRPVTYGTRPRVAVDHKLALQVLAFLSFGEHDEGMSTPPASLRRPHSETLFPPHDSTSLDPLAEMLGRSTPARLQGPTGESVDLPADVYEVLVDVVSALRRGDAVTVAPVSVRLTTSQAAEMLGVSRPTLVKLLEDGELPFERPRKHRLVRLDDVLAYREKRSRQRRELLGEITRQAVSDGLYDVDRAAYDEALRAVRRRKS